MKCMAKNSSRRVLLRFLVLLNVMAGSEQGVQCACSTLWSPEQEGTILHKGSTVEIAHVHVEPLSQGQLQLFQLRGRFDAVDIPSTRTHGLKDVRQVCRQHCRHLVLTTWDCDLPWCFSWKAPSASPLLKPEDLRWAGREFLGAAIVGRIREGEKV